MMFESLMLDVHIKTSHLLAKNRQKGSGPSIYPRCTIRLLNLLIVPITNDAGEFLRYMSLKRGQEFEALISATHANILLPIDENSQIEYTIPLLNVELL